MKFQIALDFVDLNEAIDMARQVSDLVQVLEIGTPLVLKEGARAIAAMHEAFPGHEVLADYKMMDAGGLEARIAFEAGAEIVTVCGCANLATIQNAIDEAAAWKKKVMIDMIEVKDVQARLVEMDVLGATYIQIHTSYDGRGDRSPLEELSIAKRTLKKTLSAVAGGVGPGNIAEIAALQPDLVVVGGSVIRAQNPRAEMEKIINISKGLM